MKNYIATLLMGVTLSFISENGYGNANEHKDEIPIVKLNESYRIKRESDIVYAKGLSHESINSDESHEMDLKLDVHSPINELENRPVFMFIHGGGFEFKDKKQAAIIGLANYYASRGWVFVSIDYRMKNDKGTIPDEWAEFSSSIPITDDEEGRFNAMYTATRDAKAALRWLVANKERYRINTDYITIGGASAGANTAKAVAVSDPDDFTAEISLEEDPTLSTTHLDQEFKVRTIVDFWGGQSVTDAYHAIFGKNLFDKTDPELYKAHGTADPTVPFSAAVTLKRIYDSRGIIMRLDALEGVGHGDFNAMYDEKRLEELAFEFIVLRQKLNVEKY